MIIKNIEQIKKIDVNKLLYPNIELLHKGVYITCKTYRIVENDNTLQLIEFNYKHELQEDFLNTYDYERHIHWIKEQCIRRIKSDVERYKI